jgi:hypothetical protein
MLFTRRPKKTPGQIAEENLTRLDAYHEARIAAGGPDELPGQEGIDAALLDAAINQMLGFIEKESSPLVIGGSLAIVVELSTAYIKKYLDPASETH